MWFSNAVILNESFIFKLYSEWYFVVTFIRRMFSERQRHVPKCLKSICAPNRKKNKHLFLSIFVSMKMSKKSESVFHVYFMTHIMVLLHHCSEQILWHIIRRGGKNMFATIMRIIDPFCARSSSTVIFLCIFRTTEEQKMQKTWTPQSNLMRSGQCWLAITTL